MHKIDGLKAKFGILGYGLSTTDNELKERLTVCVFSHVLFLGLYFMHFLEPRRNKNQSERYLQEIREEMCALVLNA